MEWMRRILRKLPDEENVDIRYVTVVLDNAPVHSEIEKLSDKQEFAQTQFLRLGPYSAPLNPIDQCWSILKAEIKKTPCFNFQ